MDAQFLTRQKEAQTVSGVEPLEGYVLFQHSDLVAKIMSEDTTAPVRLARAVSSPMESYMFWTSRHLLEDFPDTSDGGNPDAFSTAPTRDFGRSSFSESHELVRTPAQTTIFHMRTKFISIALDSYRILKTNISQYPKKSIDMSISRNSK